MKTYGDYFLESLKHLCEGLDLSLDGEQCTQNVQHSVSAKILTVPSNKKLTPAKLAPSNKKLTTAKFEAWKMWYEDGLSLQEIAVESCY